MNIIDVEGAKKPIFNWASQLEAQAVDQMRVIAKLPFVEHCALMPDAHLGMEAPIGSVIACKDVIVPCFVGSDCGCGMGALRTNLKKEQFTESIRNVFHQAVARSIPTGMAHNNDSRRKSMEDKYGEKIDFLFDKFTPAVKVADKKAFFSQVGTLGQGNHFIEVQFDEQDNVWVMVHSGSRNIGKCLCDYFDDIAKKLNEKWHSKSIVGFLPVDSTEGEEYLKWMNICLRFAFLNREAMMNDVVANLLHYFPEMVITTKAAVEGVDDLINIHHNYASQEHHFGKNLFVHRKGATLANAKTIGIIPGSQQTNSFITKGMGNHLSLFSSSHGSGRKMGRKDFNVQYQDKVGEIEVSMKDKGIVFTPFKKASRGRDEGMYDISESGGAYKDVISIMEDQKDLVSALVKLFPMINWKG